MTLDPQQLYEWLKTGGLLTAAAIFIWASYTRRIRWGSEFEEFKKDAQERLKQALEFADIRYKEIIAERDSRIRELIDERNELKQMVRGQQHATAKTLDVIAEAQPGLKRTR
jgi:hypothetical protein